MRKNNFLSLFFIGLLLVAGTAGAVTKKKKKRTFLQELSNLGDNGSNQGASVAGVRGLEEISGKGTKARNYAAIARLEKVEINDAELKSFLKEGKLK